MKQICSFTVSLAAFVGVILSVGCFCTDVSKQQKLADCTTNELRFQMTCSNWPPYQIVLGMPSTDKLPEFRGEIIVRQSTNAVARIPIDSRDVTPCNWLTHEGLTGYILTWNRTNRNERLSELLVRGQTYNVQITFAEMPPAESSLWLSSIGKAENR